MGGKNYGTQPDPATCGQLAEQDGYSIIMWAPEYSPKQNNWGCRACADPSGATAHAHWNLYSVRMCGDFTNGHTGPPEAPSYSHTVCSTGNNPSPSGTACNIAGGTHTFPNEPTCNQNI